MRADLARSEMPPVESLEDDLLPGRTERNRQGLVAATRETVAELLWVKEREEEYTRPRLRAWGAVLEGFLLACIVLCLFIVVLDSFDHDQLPVGFAVGRDVSLAAITAIFSVEYLLRLWSCVECPEARGVGAWKARLVWAKSPLALIDLMAILPIYFEFVFSAQGGSGKSKSMLLRNVRLLRIFSVFRLEGPIRAFRTLRQVLTNKAQDLLVTVFGAGLFILLLGTFVYSVEALDSPEVFPDIPSAMWWCVNSMQSVAGYQDGYPKTSAGKAAGSICAVIGVGLVAVPAGIIGAGFLEVHSQLEASQDHHRPFRQGARGGDSGGGDKEARSQMEDGSEDSVSDDAASASPIARGGDEARGWTGERSGGVSHGLIVLEERSRSMEERMAGMERSIANLHSLLLAHTSLLQENLKAQRGSLNAQRGSPG